MTDDSTLDHYAALREASKERRKNNRDHAPTVLQREGISYVSHNGGAHLVVESRFDYYPGTGLFIDRTTKTQHRGIRSLVQWVKGLNHGR